VAFRSTSTNLVANDTNGAPDLFVKDLDTGAVFRVTSTASAHRVGPPSLSADGRSVAFITNDPDSIRDFVQPRGAGAFVRVIGSDEPIPVGRMAAEEVNEQVRISADGSHVVYKSRLANSDEITPEVDGIINAFLVRVGPRKVWRISRTIADAVVGGLSLSGDGQVTTFATAASPNGPPRLYRLDLARWRTITLSGSGVDENMPPNSVVGTLAGSNDMNAYQFALVDDASDDDFKLVGRVVQTRLALDHEATPTRTIRVRSRTPGASRSSRT
jgi:hypothetical protein